MDMMAPVVVEAATDLWAAVGGLDMMAPAVRQMVADSRVVVDR